MGDPVLYIYTPCGICVARYTFIPPPPPTLQPWKKLTFPAFDTNVGLFKIKIVSFREMNNQLSIQKIYIQQNYVDVISLETMA